MWTNYTELRDRLSDSLRPPALAGRPAPGASAGRACGEAAAGTSRDDPAPANLPALYYLRSVDPGRNRRRHYLVGIQRDLWGNLVVLRCWGRSGARGGMRQRNTPVADLAQAVRIIRGVLRQRQRHGYVLVAAIGKLFSSRLFGGNLPD